MIPKFRIFIKDTLFMDYDVVGIDFKREHAIVDTGWDIEEIRRFKDCILMQSTGLHDVNGKEIYEGDVVNIQFVVWDFEGETEKEYKNAAIYFDTYGSQLTVPSFYIKDEYGVRLLSELAFYDENIEVIGNIYEHPDLLEKENEG